jgi:uncharacterized membrane protein YfcA
MEGILFRLFALVLLGVALIVLWKREESHVRSRWSAVRPTLHWLGGWVVLSFLEAIFSGTLRTSGGVPCVYTFWGWSLHQGANLLLLGSLWSLLRHGKVVSRRGEA